MLNALCCGKLAEGDAEDDGLPTVARAKKMRRWSGPDSAAGLPAAVVGDGGPGTDAPYRMQPAAAQRHARVSKFKSRGPAPAAQIPPPLLEPSREDAADERGQPVRRERIIQRRDFDTPRISDATVAWGKRIALDGTLRLPPDVAAMAATAADFISRSDHLSQPDCVYI